jgi:hypothetical protein
MLRVAHKSASMGIVGELTQLLQDMLNMSTTDTDTNMQMFLPIQQNCGNCLCYDLTAYSDNSILKMLNIAYSHGIHLGFQMATQLKFRGVRSEDHGFLTFTFLDIRWNDKRFSTKWLQALPEFSLLLISSCMQLFPDI